MSESMVERVARVLSPLDFTDRHDDSCLDCKEARDDARIMARAAIAAMREPTKEMLAAEGVHDNCHMCGGHVEGWQLMIDAALSTTDS